MAYTAHKTQEQIEEHFDEPEIVQQKSKLLAKWITESNFVTFFTGAGVSTSAGIPDFRGPEGVWTLGKYGGQRKSKTVSIIQAMATPTHLALVELQNQGKLGYIISQNIDGLHRKSGIKPEKISELHGNTMTEKCKICKKEYLRDFSVCSNADDHATGRKCSRVGCNGDLFDTIIHFNENLEEIPLNSAWENTKKSDLMIVFGSSLTVRPACDMPRLVGSDNKRKLVICNLQTTPLDSLATLKIHAKTDEVCKLLMDELGYKIPPFTLTRYLSVKKTPEDRIILSGIDSDGTSVSFLAAIDVLNEKGETAQTLEDEPFEIVAKNNETSNLRLHFMGHYNEPPQNININFSQNNANDSKIFSLVYNPATGQMTVEHLQNFTFSQPQISGIPNGNSDYETPNQFFAVYPRTNCPHIDGHISSNVSENAGNSFPGNGCHVCQDKRENWLCLECGYLFCGRYINGDGMKHYQQQKHPILFSFTDLSFWCYECDSYISNRKKLGLVENQIHIKKFGRPHPGFAALSGGNEGMKATFLCNCCRTVIGNYRWNCDECDDYDLCDECYKSGQGTDPHKKTHKMTKH